MRDLEPGAHDPAAIDPVSPEAQAARHDPLGWLAHDRAGQRGLADLLERVADGLPDAPDRLAARLAATLLRSGFRESAAAGELALLAAVERGRPCAAAAAAVARRDHAARCGEAVELAEALDLLAAPGSPQNPEALGLMLRAFFDGLRRRLDWIEATLAPAAERLDAREITRLGVRLGALAETGGLRSWPGLVPPFG